jgi:hypothetical protein
MIDGQLSMRVLRQELECNLRLALSYHKVYNDQALEDDGPCRVAQAVREGTEDLSDPSLAGMRRDEDMLDILRFGCCELCDVSMLPLRDVRFDAMNIGKLGVAHGYLDLGAALDALLKGAGHKVLGGCCRCPCGPLAMCVR